MNVIVSKAPVHDLLFALAREANMNVDIQSGVDGLVTLNAIDQTFPQILARISEQVDIRYGLKHGTLVIEPDTPFLKNYPIDYVNLSRTAKGDVSISTSIASPGNAGAASLNSSSTVLTNTVEHNFWRTLTENVQAILREEDRLVVVSRAVNTNPSGSNSTASTQAVPVGSSGAMQVQAAAAPANQEVSVNERVVNVIASPEGGVLAVRATARQHEKVKAFLDKVMQSAGKQVLIEATIVEVLLSNDFQAGVDWSRLMQGGNGFGISQQLSAGRLSAAPATTLTYNNKDNALFSGQFSATIRLLESFGKTKVLSSPKVMALNNQTALLKVVDEKVYFTVTLDESHNDKGDITDRKYTSALHTIPVGVVMSVVPQIGEDDQITLNIRPTISRITGYKADPVPQLMNASFQNLVPEIQMREMESILKVPNGQTVVLGGLMQDELISQKDGVPLLSRVPWIGDLFTYQSQTNTKSELVIFLRPMLVNGGLKPSTQAGYSSLLPDANSLASPQEVRSPSTILFPEGS
ncbi:pilus (MSHA type) biogenesis protein MshL [Leeia oryzae]|uniref:pilus (MSHA type) biogenesis protein MshL n=1 Tax=Leeia oryzae TaxID=356662 RepID=UPI001FDF29CB|nr:pilus (MSHA type) biogenesis protein MshL [Leeia oryzae]